MGISEGQRVSKTDEPRLTLLNCESDKIIDAPIISAPTLGVEPEMVVPCAGKRGIAKRPVECRGLKGVVQDTNPKMNADVHGEIARSTVATARPMKVDKIYSVQVLTRPEHLLRSRESKRCDPIGEIPARLLKSIADYLGRALLRSFHFLQNVIRAPDRRRWNLEFREGR